MDTPYSKPAVEKPKAVKFRAASAMAGLMVERDAFLALFGSGQQITQGRFVTAINEAIEVLDIVASGRRA